MDILTKEKIRNDRLTILSLYQYSFVFGLTQPSIFKFHLNPTNLPQVKPINYGRKALLMLIFSVRKTRI